MENTEIRFALLRKILKAPAFAEISAGKPPPKGRRQLL
jgi:hypothetical protein